MAKRALGKGIGALIEETDVGQRPAAATAEVPVAVLKPNPKQPRRSFRDAALRELADSIRQRGMLQPVLVEADGDGTYTILVGERRVRAARLAGLATVPVVVRTVEPDEHLELALVENLQREDLTPIEEALAFRQLMEARGLSQEQVAAKVGKDRSTVANSVRLLKLPEAMRAAVDAGELSPGHARALLSLVNPADQQLLFERIMKRGLSVREVEQAAGLMSRGRRGARAGKSRGSDARPRDPDVRAIEERLIERFGTKVEIRGGRSRGKIEIAYFSADDLDRVLDLLQGGR